MINFHPIPVNPVYLFNSPMLYENHRTQGDPSTMARTAKKAQSWFEKKDRVSMWQTMLPGASRAQVDHLTRFSVGGAEGLVDGKNAMLMTTQMDYNGAIIMLQARLTVGDRYMELVAFNTDSSNAQPSRGPFFRVDHIEIGTRKGNEISDKQVFKAPALIIARGVTKLFNAVGLRNEITPLQMDATTTVLAYVLKQFQAKRPVRFADIAAVFDPKSLKKLPPVSAWRLHAGTIAPLRKKSTKHTP